MRRYWIGLAVMSLLSVVATEAALAAEDALPGESADLVDLEYDEYESRSALSPSRWSIDRGYPGEVVEKLLFGTVDIIAAPIELVATPFRRAFWADSTKRPVLEFFALGVPEGVMNASFRMWTGVANVATFPIASSQSRFSNYSIWYWDRYRASL